MGVTVCWVQTQLEKMTQFWIWMGVMITCAYLHGTLCLPMVEMVNFTLCIFHHTHSSKLRMLAELL